jgi:hypothetical protein
MLLRASKVYHRAALARDGAIIFGDLIGKLGVLRIECAKWGRSGPVPPPENAQRRAETAMTRRR